MEEFKPVVFRVGAQKFGVDINIVRGIEKEQDIVDVPNTAEYIKGIINLRGDVIPVYSLKKKFHMPDDKCDEPQYIIVMIKGSLMALEVDGVEEIHNVEEDMLHQVPAVISDGDTSYMQSVVSLGKDLVIIINIDRLLSDSEYEKMDKLVKNQ